MMKKGLIMGLAILMLCASLVIVPEKAEGAKNLQTLAAPPVGILPKDMAWKPDGSVALMVGFDSNGNGKNAAFYDARSDTWTELFAFPVGFTGYTLNAVTWAEGYGGGGGWVCVGDSRGPGFSSAYYIMDGDDTLFDLTSAGSDPTDVKLDDVASDRYGSVLIVSSSFQDYVKFFSNSDYTWYDVANADDPGIWFGIDYDSNNDRYYLVGQDSGGSYLMTQYSDQIVASFTIVGNHYQCGAVASANYFKDIYWNNNPDLPVGENFGILLSSDNHIYSMEPIEMGVNLEICTSCPSITYTDMAWDTNNYYEATLIGQNPNAVIYQYNALSDAFVKMYENVGVSGYCVAYKPPASPGWPMILSSAGAVKLLVSEFDISTRLTANAVFPKIYAIGFQDSAAVSRMDQQVPVNDWYNFTVEGNYSQGWNNLVIELRAYHDGGAVPGAYPVESAATRALAFKAYYWPNNGTYKLMYPIAPLLEFQVNDLWLTDVVTVAHADATQSTRMVTMPVWFGPQMRWGDGTGFGSLDDAGNDGEYDINLGCQDANSWNFNVTLRDINYYLGYNTSHAEFGIDETVSISVAGNPYGNAPPGSSNVALANPSQITYSANTGYWVNVSIQDLLENGVGPGSIAAGNVDVQNADPVANAGNSQIPIQTAITGPGTEMVVWGSVASIAAPSNGTVACGPWVSDYNAGGLGYNDFTVLNWWISVPVSTSEGIYWTVITVTIDS